MQGENKNLDMDEADEMFAKTTARLDELEKTMEGIKTILTKLDSTISNLKSENPE